MTTKILLSFWILLIIPYFAYSQKVNPVKENKFTGTYNGLNEEVEFEFIASDGKIYVFQEIGEDVTVDLYEEENFEKIFEVVWIKQTVDILDEEGEPSGEMEQIQVIISLKEK
jgi:hypothetical protein